MMKKINLVFLGIIAALFLITSCAKQELKTTNEDRVKEVLIGYNITYYNIAGKPMNYTVKESDILSIENGNYKEAVWKVRVGKSLAWDIYLDKDFNIVRQDQLFRT